MTFTADDAFIFGVANGATSASGPQTATPVTTPFQNYPVMGGVNQRSPVATSSITVNFPAAGSYPYEVDYAKGGDSNLTLSMQAGGLPIPAATLLTLSPGAGPSLTQGQILALNVAAMNNDGTAAENVPVTVNVIGPNAQSRPLSTGGTGQVEFAYAGNHFVLGTDQIQATAVINGAAVYSNIVTQTWNAGINQAPVVGAGFPQTITLPAQAILDGLVSDDGLPNNTLTITWSLQSGPAPVVFGDTSQPSTSAAFSVAGTYVLQLSAFDGALTTTSTVTITVNANPNWSAGWLANPLDRSTVMGQVPVTLVSGITLVSGSLTYYPASNPSASVTLNANTTGTGQIGAFDATLLTNGAYWVQLIATDSAGVTQTNLALVTVAGNYKPGRVLATVTDFTVPAPGLPIQIQRTYDSLTRGSSLDFGFGWRLGVQVNLQVNPTGDVTFTINNQTRTFYFTPDSTILPGFFVPAYTGEAGFYGSLSTTGDNCEGVLLAIGNIYQCGIDNAGAQYQALGFVYTDPYGHQYTISATGALQSVQDLNGNTLTVAPTGITSSNGLNVPFVRDSQGRITQITDTLGNVYQYAYDANGNLASVTDPGIATADQYSYDPTHLLTSEKDPNGNTSSSQYYPDGTLQSITDAAGQTTSYVYNVPANTTTITNPDGGTVTTVTDSYGKPLDVTDPLGRTTTNSYDSNHNLLTTTDPLNETTTYTYDANGFQTSKQDPLGNTWTMVNNQFGEPTSVTDPLNFVQYITYDANFNPSTLTDSIGQVAAFTYNAQALPLTVEDALAQTTTYTYDQYGNKLSSTDPLIRTTSYQYNTEGWLTQETDPRGNGTQYRYDSLGRMTSTSDAYNNVTSYAYDSNNNKISDTDALGRVTRYSYDAVNRRTGTTYADGTTKSYSYDFRKNKLTETDQLGRVTKWVYDLAGQLTSTTVAFGTLDAATTSYTYDPAGRKLTETDPRGNTTAYAYDAAGRTISVKDAVGNLTQYGYDAKGQRVLLTDGKGRVTTYAYDARDRQLSSTFPDNTVASKTYDGDGNVITSTDEDGRTTSYGYDAARQLTQVTDALGQLTQYGYDNSGNKTSQIDANGHRTTYFYDKLNRRTSRTLPAGQSESDIYDAVGNKTTHFDFNGKTTVLAYDSLNRQLARTPDASFSAPPISFTYTGTGKRASMIDPSGTTNYTYTNRDQVLTKATPEGTLAYTYDLSGNVSSVLSSNANGANVGYAWDADNRLQTVTDNRTNGVTTYGYDATSQVSSFVYPNSVTHSFGYDPRDRPTSLSLGSIASYLQSFTNSGHKTGVLELSGRSPAYQYDQIWRLTQEAISGDPVATNNGVLSYMLDPVGNRTSLTSTLAALPNQSFTYDADDRLNTDTYDANGNTLASGGTSYTYDFEDRLVTTSNGVTIVYDGDGNRVSETAAGITTKYLVDDLTPTHYAQVAEETVNGAVTAQFTYGLMRISQNRSGTVSYYGYDPGGSVRDLLSPSGAGTDTYAYDAFGNTVAQTGSTANEFLYRAEQRDATLDSYYLRARYYSPDRDRFATTDETDGFSEVPLSEHKYLYAEGDPIAKADPSGNSAVEVAEEEGFELPNYRDIVFILSLAVGANYDPEEEDHRGKFQAQGSDFRDAGKGLTVPWQLAYPLPKVNAELLLTSLYSQLSDVQRENRTAAYAKALEFIRNTGPERAHFERSFPTEKRGQLQRMLNRKTCPQLDCRIDVEVTKGVAFVPLL